MTYAIEVKGAGGKWLKFRTGSRKGKQVVLTDQRRASDWLRSAGLQTEHYRIVRRP